MAIWDSCWSNEHNLFNSFFKKLRGHDLLFWWPYLSPEICFDWSHQNVEHEKYWQFDQFSGYMLSGWTGKYIRGCAVYIIRKFNMIHGCNKVIWISISLWKVEKLRVTSSILIVENVIMQFLKFVLSGFCPSYLAFSQKSGRVETWNSIVGSLISLPFSIIWIPANLGGSSSCQPLAFLLIIYINYGFWSRDTVKKLIILEVGCSRISAVVSCIGVGVLWVHILCHIHFVLRKQTNLQFSFVLLIH